MSVPLEEVLGRRRPREFFEGRTRQVAIDLLGEQLVHVVDGVARIGRIVETEAYLGPPDRAQHSSGANTPRTRVMFGPPGFAYVYRIYGRYHCLNLVTGPVGRPEAVLVRALEPISGLDGATRGPGLLCQAMGISLAQYGMDLEGDTLFVAAAPPGPRRPAVVRRPRIGMDYAGAWAERPLRFYLRGNAWISRP